MLQSIARLVADPAALAAVWEREPLLSTDLGGFDDVFGVAEVQRMLVKGLPASTVRLFSRGRSLPPDQVARPANPNARNHLRLADYRRVAAHIREGYTLVLDEVQSHSPRVAEFAAALAAQTGYAVDCTAFLTPPHSQGVAPHTDAASLFLRQVHGAKRWRISAPAQLWPARRWREGDPARPVLDVVLEAGQCLYLPRGYVHVGETLERPSMHLAASMDVPAWGSLLEAAVRAVVADAQPLREPLPPLFAEVDRERLLRERVALLAERLAKVQWSELAPGAPPSPVPVEPGDLAAALDTPPGPR